MSNVNWTYTINAKQALATLKSLTASNDALISSLQGGNAQIKLLTQSTGNLSRSFGLLESRAISFKSQFQGISSLFGGLTRSANVLSAALSGVSAQMKAIGGFGLGAGGAGVTGGGGTRVSTYTPRPKHMITHSGGSILTPYSSGLSGVGASPGVYTPGVIYDVQGRPMSSSQYAHRQETESQRRLNETRGRILEQQSAAKIARYSQLDAARASRTSRYGYAQGARAMGLGGLGALPFMGLSAGATAGLLGGYLGYRAVKTYSDYEYGLAEYMALNPGDAAGAQMLGRQARRIGASTPFTIEQTQGAQRSLSRMGYGAQDVRNITRGAVSLSLGTGLDGRKSGALIGATLGQFGLPSSQARRIADQVTYTTAKSNVDATQMIRSLQYMSAGAKLKGLSTAQVMAMIGVGGDVTGGLPVRFARTLHSGLSNIWVGAGADTALKGVGIDRSSYASMPALLDRIHGQYQTLSPRGRAEFVKSISGGVRQQSSVLNLLERYGQYRSLSQSILNDSSGFARYAEGVKRRTLRGRGHHFLAQLERAGSTYGQILAPLAGGAMDFGSALLGGASWVGEKVAGIDNRTAQEVLLSHGRVSNAMVPFVAQQFSGFANQSPEQLSALMYKMTPEGRVTHLAQLDAQSPKFLKAQKIKQLMRRGELNSSSPAYIRSIATPEVIQTLLDDPDFIGGLKADAYHATLRSDAGWFSKKMSGDGVSNTLRYLTNNMTEEQKLNTYMRLQKIGQFSEHEGKNFLLNRVGQGPVRAPDFFGVDSLAVDSTSPQDFAAASTKAAEELQSITVGSANITVQNAMISGQSGSFQPVVAGQ